MGLCFLRCGHCKGFYELGVDGCRYCGKDVPMKGPEGKARVFPDRAACRAIQIAEYERLPREAHDDCFGPDPELLAKKCFCMHCGEDAGYFEAVEMRWIVNEQMWACPCTTCGGRGFKFDVQVAERLWQCFECHHWYAPANGDYRGSNARCPRCGCRYASGFFDDEYEEDDEEKIAEGIELPPEEGMKASEMVEFVEFVAGDDDDEEDQEWWKAAPAKEARKLPDDIDFPRPRPKKDQGGKIRDDDIPY